MSKIVLRTIDYSGYEISCTFEGNTQDEDLKTFYNTGLTIKSTEYDEYSAIVKVLSVDITHITEEEYRNLQILFRINNFEYISKDEFIYLKNCRIDSNTLKLTRKINKTQRTFYRTGSIIMKEVI